VLIQTSGDARLSTTVLLLERLRTGAQACPDWYSFPGHVRLLASAATLSRQVDGKKVGLTFLKNYANVDDVFKNVLKMKMLVQNLSQKCCILLFQKKYRFNILESCWSTLTIIGATPTV
jgi:hypothetical protein